MLDRLHIRFASASDAEPLAKLAERAFRDAFAANNAADDVETYIRQAFDVGLVLAELSDPANTFLLAFVNHLAGPIGYAKLRSGMADPSVGGPDPVELQRLYLDPAAIGRGVGAALLRAALDVAQSAGHRTMWLGVWERNARAISFYERWGFKVVGDQPFRLGSTDWRDLVMERPVAEAITAP